MEAYCCGLDAVGPHNVHEAGDADEQAALVSDVGPEFGGADVSEECRPGGTKHAAPGAVQRQALPMALMRLCCEDS